MELYYRDLISEDASLERLVDDLALLVQGNNESAARAEPEHHRREKIQSLLHRIRAKAAERAAVTDQVVRRSPYVSAGVAFGLGLLLGALLPSRHSD